MRGFTVNPTTTLHHDLPIPVLQPGEALIQVILVGICRTDGEIQQGYLPFRGILGHEFVGRVVEAPGHEEWLGKRVVGEINLPCGQCPQCRQNHRNQCLHRQAIGIRGRDGCMADFLSLPVANLHPVPDNVSDWEAVFTEPLAAALAIPESFHIQPSHEVAVIGDGKLGLLIAQVLALTGCAVTLLGHHPERVALLGISNITSPQKGAPLFHDVVVECSGSQQGLQTALQLVRARGLLILKSSFHQEGPWPGNDLVVREITLAGSRCGPFPPALRLLERKLLKTTPLITATYPLQEAVAALKFSQTPGVLKVLLQP